MPPSPGDHSRTRSSPTLDANAFQLLYEVERRLDEKFHESRSQTKEDIGNALSPILLRLETIDSRLQRGEDRFSKQEERLNEHSDTINDAMKLVQEHRNKCPVKKKEPETGEITKKKSMPWWLPLLLGGALAFLGERIARAAINAVADPPVAPVVQKP
jgi:hypothetical protein